MHKILYAINFKKIEDMITERIKDEYMAVGAVTYKEGILDKLGTTGADTLIIRDTLSGNMDFERLLRRIRVEYPETRIIVICAERPKGAPFLESLVNLGIYDIINSDKPTLIDIVSYIKTPRTYRDAVQYGIGVTSPTYTEKEVSEDIEEAIKKNKKKRNFINPFEGLFSAAKKKEQEPVQEITPIHTPDVAVKGMDLELLRETYKESAVKEAQKDMDALIRKVVEEQTAALQQEIAFLRNENSSLKAEVEMAENQSMGTVEETNSLRAERDRLQLLLNDTRKEMSTGFELYEEQLRALQNPVDTPAWYQEQSALWERQKMQLTKELNEKTNAFDELTFKTEMMDKQLKEKIAAIADLEGKLERSYHVQINSKEADDLITQLRGELSELQSKEIAIRAELDVTKEELKIAREGGPDYSQPLVDVPLLPDDTIYTASGRSPQTVLMLSSKHGAGNTTLALNLATALAMRNYKTLLIEVNGFYPMLGQYLEFTHIPFGFVEAITAISKGELSKIDNAIIRPHGLRPTQLNLSKTYKKLPAGLHFMLFSNESLISRNYEGNSALTNATIFTLLSYLTKRQQYSHVILDIQPDDRRLFQCLMNSGFPIDKLIMTITQDPHSLATAGHQITQLSRAHASSLVAGAEFIVNRFNPNAISQAKIEKMLHLGSSQISKMGEDSAGYLNAASIGLPYILCNGRFKGEFDTVFNKIFI